VITQTAPPGYGIYFLRALAVWMAFIALTA